MKVRYVLPGHGGDFECAEGHDGSTMRAVGIPFRCPAFGCDAVTKRTGDGSQKANRLLRSYRSEGRARTAAATAARSVASAK